MSDKPVVRADLRARKALIYFRNNWQLYFLLLIPITFVIIFKYAAYPGMRIAFMNYKPAKGFDGSPWVGMETFQKVFKDKSFHTALKNSLIFNFLDLIVGFPVPVILALLLNELRFERYKKVSQTILYLPHFLSWVVISYFVFAFLSTDKGLVNMIIVSMGGQPILWYQEPKYWPYLLTFINTWKTFGYSMVVYMATITGIDHSLYESAVIDGASKWQQTWGITIPLLRPVISIMFIMNVGSIFSTDFGLFFQVTRDSNSLINVTQTLDVYVHKALIQSNNYNYSSAVALLQSVFGCILLIISNIVVKKIVNEVLFLSCAV